MIMNSVYIFSFEGLWPVGAYLAVTTTTVAGAFEIAQAALAQEGFDPESLCLHKTMDPKSESVYMIANGDY